MKTLELENILEMRHAFRNFPLRSLGLDQKNCGGAQGKKQRHEVLNRVASLGSGLSTAQKNDWTWFKDAWDAQGVKDFGNDWPWAFSSWIQEVLNLMEKGQTNAMSTFVHDETQRCFSEEPTLGVPGAG